MNRVAFVTLFEGPGAEIARDDVLRLREFKLDDVPWYFGLDQHDDMWQFTTGWAVARREQAEYLVNLYLEQAQKSPRTEYRFVRERSTGEPIGFCMMAEVAWEVCEVGWYLTPGNWGGGLGTRAAKLIVGWAFEKAGYYRAQATAHPDNAASLRVIEKVGFTYVGYVRDYCRGRDHAKLTDEWQDRQMYSMSRYDWTGEEPKRGRFPSYPEN